MTPSGSSFEVIICPRCCTRIEVDRRRIKPLVIGSESDDGTQPTYRISVSRQIVHQCRAEPDGTWVALADDAGPSA